MYYFLIDCLVDLALLKVGILNSPAIIIPLQSVFAFRSGNSCLIYLDTTILGVCILRVVMSFDQLASLSLYVDLLCLL